MPATESKSVHRRLASGIVYNFIATFFAQGSTFATNIIVARMLGVSLFGQFSVVLITLSTVSNVSLMSMSSVVTKFAAEYRQKDPDLAGRAIAICSRISNVMGVVGLLATALLSGLIADVILKDPALSIPLLAGSIYIFFQNRAQFITGLLSGLEEYYRTMVAGVVSGIAYVAIIAFGAYEHQVLGGIAGLSAATVVYWLCLYVMAHPTLKLHGIPKVRKYDEFERNLLFHFAVPAICSGLLLVPGAWWLAADLYRTCGKEAAANYNACTFIRIVILFVPIVITNVGTSVLNNSLGTKAYALTQRLSTTAILLFGTVVFAIVALLAPKILLLVYGKQYVGSASVLIVLAASTIAEGLGYGQRQRINAHRLMWSWLFYVILPWQVSAFCISLWAIPRYGAMGAAGSYAIGVFVFAVASWLLSHLKVRSFEESAGNEDASF